jgi:predicted AlkP superfamily phosphohydrolase/phosphomutase
MIAVLQFDSASVAVIDGMLAEGRLPALAELAAGGRRVKLRSGAADFAAGAFYSLYSGVELADHGIFYPFQWSPREQRGRYASFFEAPPAVWERLAERGLRTLAVDPYESRPPRRAEGAFVCGWAFKDRVVLPRWSRPRRTGARLALRHGRGPWATEVFGRPTPRDLVRLRDRLVAAPGRVADAAGDLLARGRFDLVWLTFSAAHLAGHQFWDLSQLDPASLDAATRRVLERALEDVYAAVDRALARAVALLPAGCDVIVTSPVGMDVNTSRADLLPGMLAAVLAGRPLGGSGAGSIWRLRGAIPARARGAIARALPDRAALALTSRLELRGVDWGSATAFAHPADNQGYVRLNLRGRERDGIVDPGDAESLAAEIASGLATFADPGGSPSVAEVIRVRDEYRGERADRLPDLAVRWGDRPATRLAGVRSRRYGEVARSGSATGRAGNHTPDDGWALVVPGSSRWRDPGRPPRLVDVAATVCAVTGADPTGLPGEAMLDPG